MRVVVAEKPSVARDLARVLGASTRREGFLEGDDVLVTWCVGHLVELDDPSAYDPAWKAWRLDALPMVPDAFRLRPRKEGRDQLEVVRRLLRDRRVREVVNACDAGREGELIFRYVYEYVGCRTPVRRLWVSSMTDEALRQAWARLEPGDARRSLADAARCRSEADWLVGLNVTRAMTCRTREAGGDALWSVGRVQTPTLAMIVRRDQEIEAFVPQPFWQVKATFEVPRSEGAARWEAAWFGAIPGPADGEQGKKADGDDEIGRAERLPSLELAEAVVAAARGRHGVVSAAGRREQRESPPLLYDLTALQRRANQRYGMSADRTLEVAQALYETHKLITYPRTDARYLTSDQAGELPAALRALAALDVYRPFAEGLLAAPLRIGARIVNDGEVGDHHAILPTARAPEPGRLSADERRVYDLVARRLMAALSPDAVFDLAEIVVEVPAVGLPAPLTAPLRFRARGRVQRVAGWRAVDPPGASKDRELPDVRQGEQALAVSVKSVEGQTRPPRPHDDASLLLAMETAGRELDDRELARAMRSAGLGTPATRAAILQTLVERKYVVREQKALRATPRGRALIEVLPVEELKSAELTGRWEARLSAMVDGRDQRDRFMADVAQNVRDLVDAIRGAALAAVMQESTPGPEVGRCPKCGGVVRAAGRGYRCAAACGFRLWGEVAHRALSPTMVKELLRGGRTKVVKGFKSKAGKAFEAALELRPDFSVGLWFPPRAEGAAPVTTAPGEDVAAAASRAGGRAGAARTSARAAGPADRAAGPAPRPRSGGRGAGAAGAAAAGAGGARAGVGDGARSSAPVRTEAPAAGDPVEGRPCPRCREGRVMRGRAAWGCDRWQQGCAWRLSFLGDDGLPRDPAAVRRAVADEAGPAGPRRRG